MHKKLRRTGTAAAVLLTAVYFAAAQPPAAELTIKDVLQLAAKNSPALSAAQMRETEAQYSVGEARSGYMPTLRWDEMDSSMFPESSETLGIGGLIGSPYRSGRISEAVAEDTLWDFGRTSYGVREAKEQVALSREDARVTRYLVEKEALAAFYDCSRYRAQTKNWGDLYSETQLVAAQVDHFVRIGQRSVVDRLMARAQTEDAQIEQAGFAAQWKNAAHRLSIWTGLPENQAECPDVASQSSQMPAAENGVSLSPLVSRAMTEKEAARIQVSQTKSGYWPKILVAATAGDLDAAGAKEMPGYAFAGGITIPLFDGLRTPNEVWKAEAFASEKDQALAAVKQDVADLNARYDETIDSSRAQLAYLNQALKNAQEAFRVAKDRYFSFQGTVTDLRDSLTNLAQIKTQIINVQATLLTSSGEKDLLNGAE